MRRSTGIRQATYKVEQYNDNSIRIIRLLKSSNDIQDDLKKCNNKKNNVSVEDDLLLQELSSLSRTKRNIRRICLSNSFEYFATWTIDSKLADRYSLTACVDKMKELLKAFQRMYKDFKYIYVIEKHKDGAFHFHGLVKGIPQNVLQQFVIGDTMSKHIADKVKKGAIIYHIPFFDNKLGFNSFTAINHYDKCCNYIIKYISKDCIQTTENQRYFCSRGLSKGLSYEVSYIPNELFENIRAYSYKLDADSPVICTVRDFQINSLQKADILNATTIKDLPTLKEILQKILKIKKDY